MTYLPLQQLKEVPWLNFSSGHFLAKHVPMDGVFSFRSSIRVLSILWNGYFRIDGVKSVFFGGDFIIVTKYDDEGVEWKVIDRMRLHVL